MLGEAKSIPIDLMHQQKLVMYFPKPHIRVLDFKQRIVTINKIHTMVCAPIILNTIVYILVCYLTLLLAIHVANSKPV